MPSITDRGAFLHLMSNEWRLNNLYTISDKEGVERILELNHAQKVVLLQYRHNKKIILKSRQQGISTLYVAYYLDKCLFTAGYQAGIQSYGRSESKKLKQRALLMWDRLDPIVKRILGVRLLKSNDEGLEFSNGSILKIGNFRGDTLQGLHVSELAKISRLYPEKARELKTGAFQAVSTRSRITIETTGEGDSGLFVDMWNLAVAVKDSGRELTPLDFQAIFLPWFNDPDCLLEHDYPTNPESELYLSDLRKEIPDLQLKPQQINWLRAKILELGYDFDREYPATPDRAFSSPTEGSYFAKQLVVIKREGRIKDLSKYNRNYKVDVAFDLGLNDEMVLLFTQTIAGKVYLIDEFHDSGHGIPYYVDYMRTLPYNYNYGEIILPHDANVKDLGSGRTRVEIFRSLGLSHITVLSRLSFQDSIEAGRSLLLSPNFIISDKCVNLISALQNYRKKYDRALGVFMPIDVHDIHSNYGASLRYLAQARSTYSLDVVNKAIKKYRNSVAV